MKMRWGGVVRLAAGVVLWGAVVGPVWAQEAAAGRAGRAAAAAPAAAAAGDVAAPAGATVEGQPAAAGGGKTGTSFIDVIRGSGWAGIALWLGLLLASLAGVYLVIDSYVKIRVAKIMQPALVERVRQAMAEGDLAKAMGMCKEEPGVMSNILMAGFSNVEEGFDVIQDVINAVADLESEKLMQKVTYLSVVSNLAPMLGLMGTVQGMIYAFGSLATMEAGAAQQAMLALNISQALYTTMAGLAVSIPAVAFFYFFRNQANNIILNMVITTIDLVKSLRNVEVVDDSGVGGGAPPAAVAHVPAVAHAAVAHAAVPVAVPVAEEIPEAVPADGR